MKFVAQIAYGQAIVILIVLGGIFCDLMAQYGIHTQMLNLFGVYFILSFGILVRQRPRKAHLAWYCAEIFCDVHANVLLLFAFDHTTLSSVQACSFVTIIGSVGLTRFFLHVQYFPRHIIGIAISFLGLVGAIVSDIVQGEELFHSLSEMILGDALAILSYFLFSISNVTAECIVKRGDSTQNLLWRVGMMGSIITLVESFFLKEYNYLSLFNQHFSFLYYFGFVAVAFLSNSLIPNFLKYHSAAFFNLSNMFSPIYASLLQSWIFGLAYRSIFFYLSMLVIFSGISLFSSIDPVYPQNQDSLSNELLY